jgi:uncharacterized protein YjiS (DUF1127 family)
MDWLGQPTLALWRAGRTLAPFIVSFTLWQMINIPIIFSFRVQFKRESRNELGALSRSHTR